MRRFFTTMDLILLNGKIHTMDSSLPTAEACAVKGGKFAKVGSNEAVLRLKTEDTEVIDLHGKVLLPGFNDSHMHLFSFGYGLGMVNLLGTKSVKDIIEKTKDFISEKKVSSGRWIQGRGWNHDYFEGEKRFPVRYDLDKISTEHPIVLSRVCGHVAVVNSKALELAGITDESSQVDGGHFDIDATGEPTGVFREKALELIFSKIPQPELEEVKNMLKEAAAYANSKGVTSVQSDDLEHLPSKDFRMMLRAYRELKDSGELTLRVYQQCLLSTIDRFKDFLSEGYTTGQGDELFKIGPLKILADGSLGARTAALSEPYSDEPTTKGILVYSAEELDELVRTAHDAGMHVAIHCIGDAVMYMAFDSIDKALKAKPRKDHRHSIVHCQITDDTLLERYKELDVFAHVQPIFLHYDLHMVEERLGKERASRTYAFKTMLNKGVHVGLGSDCPVEPLDPMPNIYCSITRRDLNGYPEQGWLPQEKLTLEEALYCYTMGSAYASFEENIKGSITEGKLADMVVLSEDIFRLQQLGDYNKIKDIKAEMTFLGGKRV
jgi:predicted amidohydrolase YtcJ